MEVRLINKRNLLLHCAQEVVGNLTAGFSCLEGFYPIVVIDVRRRQSPDTNPNQCIGKQTHGGGYR